MLEVDTQNIVNSREKTSVTRGQNRNGIYEALPEIFERKEFPESFLKMKTSQLISIKWR